MTVDEIKEEISKLTDAERVDLLSEYCLFCGCADPMCQCSRDE